METFHVCIREYKREMFTSHSRELGTEWEQIKIYKHCFKNSLSDSLRESKKKEQIYEKRIQFSDFLVLKPLFFFLDFSRRIIYLNYTIRRI